MGKILIIKLGAFGDIIQSLGAMLDIRIRHRHDEITVMTTPAHEKLFHRCPLVDSVIIDPRASRLRPGKMIELRNKVCGLAPDLIYDLQQVGRTRFYRQFLLRDLVWAGPFPPRKENGCAAERLADYLTSAGLVVKNTLHPDPTWMTEGITLPPPIAEKLVFPYVVLIPGTSPGHLEKRWLHYDQLASWFRRQSLLPVTVPGPSEMELCRSFRHAEILTDGERFLDIFKLALVLKNARFIVGNDTGPTHLGAHLGIPGLALFSSHLSPERTGIQYSRFSHIQCADLQRLSLERVIEHLQTIPPLISSKHVACD